MSNKLIKIFERNHQLNRIKQ